MANKSKKAPHLSVAVTRAQLQDWTHAADRTHRTLSSWVRLILDEQAGEIAANAESPQQRAKRLVHRINVLSSELDSLLRQENVK